MWSKKTKLLARNEVEEKCVVGEIIRRVIVSLSYHGGLLFFSLGFEKSLASCDISFLHL